MTLEEAKDMLKKEFAVINLHKSTEPFEFDESGWIEHEKPSVLEAFRVLSKEGYYITISGHDYNMRKKRLEKEYEKNTKAPGSGEEQPKEGDLKAATKMFGAQAREIMRLTAENAELRETIDKKKEGNPALKESASQFNDALLDEQAKDLKRLGKEISKLNGIIHKKNLKIDELGKESSRHLEGKMKMFGENFDLEQMLKDKNAVLSDVAEELRLSKIREKNLTEVCQKYVKEVEDLREKLADKVVDKIDAQALKSAESALAYKEKVIAEKDEVIADLGNELAATKKELEEKTKLVEVVRKGSKEYCEYGIAAEKMIQKMAKVIVSDKPVSLKDFKEYRRLANGYSFNPQLFDFSEEEKKKLSLIRDDSVGAVTNQKNCSHFKDTHPTEDSPEEVELDEILELFIRL